MSGRAQHLLKPKAYNVIKCKSRDEFFFPVEKVLTTDLLPGFQTTSENEYSIVGTIAPGEKKLLYTCSKVYNLISNQELFLPIEEALHAKGISFNATYSHTSHQKFYADYVLVDTAQFVGKEVDTIMPKFQIQHSYDGGTKFNVIFGIFRLVCSNGLTVPLKGAERLAFNVTTKHTDALGIVVQDFMIHLNKFVLAWNTKHVASRFVEMTERSIESVQDRINEVAAATLFPKRLIPDTLDIVERERKILGYDKPNEWLVYNALNEVLFSTRSIMQVQDKNLVDEKVLNYMLFPKESEELVAAE